MELREHVPSPNLAQSTFQAIAIHDPPPVLRHDDPQPAIRNGGRRQEDIHVLRPLALPPLKECADLIGAADANEPGKTFPPVRHREGYLLPTFTTSRCRPFLRRRDSVMRPARVFILARNPCLLTRFRLRGLYVGFIRDRPSHRSSSFRNELGKIAPPVKNSQRPRLPTAKTPVRGLVPPAVIDFSTSRF